MAPAATIVVSATAMLWIGSSILAQSPHQMDWHLPAEAIHHLPHSCDVGREVPELLVTEGSEFILDFLVGLILTPIGTKIMAPIWLTLLGNRPGLIDRARLWRSGKANPD